MEKKLDIYSVFKRYYLMEHTFLSSFGYVLGYLAFVFALLSSVSYFFSARNEGDLVIESNWKRIARIAFLGHSASVITLIGLLFYLLLSHFYEFQYIWKYSNNSMPLKYIFACFWGGQEGSFLLWTFWNVVIGCFLMWKAKKWESSVMAPFSLIQVFLSSMILGVYVFDLKIGSSPFVLTRMLPENLGLPWTEMEDYITKLPQKFGDGKGLNPLLRNYWMTIHPPTLFLGFALTAVPFCYAIAGLWRKKMVEWIKPALPWTFIGVGILGIGILMGGAWAYESLSFGGFWAWDPVENVSYIPWLTFVGAGHLMLINKRKPVSLFLTFILALLSFILVLYSTFLTKSGVLGDSSVHAFTDNGMLGQLLIYILFFVWLSVYAILGKGFYRIVFTTLTLFISVMGFLADYEESVLGINPSGVLFTISFAVVVVFLVLGYLKNFPRSKSEDESIWSREFWMFLGSFVLFLACIQIFWDNSFPVWNKLFNQNNAKPDPFLLHYNVWQGAFAVFVCFFIGFTQFLKYKKTSFKKFLSQISISLSVSIFITVLCLYVFDFKKNYDLPTKMIDDFEPIVYVALLFTSIYAVIGNIDYYLRLMKGKLNVAGSSIAHIGFGLILFGALISNSQSKKLTNNMKGKFDLASLSEDFKNDADAQITMGDTVDVNEYFITLNKRWQEGINIYYEMDYFEKVNTADGYRPGKKMFTLNPFVQLNEQFGNAAEPSTKHYWSYDVFSFIKYPNPSMFEGQNNGYMPYEQFEMDIGDTVITGVGRVIAKDFELHPYMENDKAGRAVFSITDFKDEVTEDVQLVFMIQGDSVLVPAPAEKLRNFNAKVRMPAVSPAVYGEDSVLIQPAKVSFDLAEKEYVVVQAKTFPLINLLWLGIVIMLIGSIMAAFNRIKLNRKSNK